jgi:hypothetical protein
VVLKESGRTYGLHIIEWGKNDMNNVVLGREGAQWFRSMMAKVITLSLLLFIHIIEVLNRIDS